MTPVSANADVCIEPPQTLPVWDTASEIVNLAWRDNVQFARLASIPCILYSAISVSLSSIMLQGGAGHLPILTLIILVHTVASIAFIPVMTARVRAVAVGPPLSLDTTYRWGGRETQYLKRALQFFAGLLAIEAVLPVLVVLTVSGYRALHPDGIVSIQSQSLTEMIRRVPFLAPAATCAALGVAVWFNLSYQMIFPAAATGGSSAFHVSAALCRGYRLRILGIALLVAICVQLTNGALSLAWIGMAAATNAIFGNIEAPGMIAAVAPTLKGVIDMGIRCYVSLLAHATMLGIVYRRIAAPR